MVHGNSSGELKSDMWPTSCGPEGAPSLLVRTQVKSDVRNRWLASLAEGDAPKAQNDYVREVHNSLRLPDYER